MGDTLAQNTPRASRILAAPLARKIGEIMPDPVKTYLLLTAQELLYLEACIFVADGEGDQSDRFGVDQVALGTMIRKKVRELVE